MSKVSTPSQLYADFDIERRHDAVDTYNEDESWFGDGNYPPDWGKRREAVKQRDNYRCLRCSRSLGNVNQAHAHHLTPLKEGGTNELSNLATLCSQCHAALHEVVEPVDADWKQAPVFPAPDAPDSLSVIHKGILVDNDAETTGVSKVVELLDIASGNDGANWLMGHGHHHDFSPEAARQLPAKLGEYLEQCGLALDEDRQGLVVRIENGAEQRRAQLYNAVVESGTGGMPLSEPPVPGVVVTTLPADDEQATVKATTDDGYIEHSFELGDTPFTLVRLRTSGLYDDMAPPWRESAENERPYDPDELPDDPIDFDEDEFERDPDPPIAITAITLGAYALAATVGGLSWILFFVLGVVAAFDISEFVNEHVL